MSQTPLAHRIWHGGTLMLMLMITLSLSWNSFYKFRPLILDSAELQPEHEKPGKKVILVLYDALREDFIEWPDNKEPNLSLDAAYAYKGKKGTLFRRLVEEEPENSFLVPFRSEMPTITAIRIKTFLSGVVGSVQDFMEGLSQNEFTEDTILKQMYAKKKDQVRTLFFGEDIWVSNFGKYFTKEVSLHDPDVRDLETNDDTASKHIYEELDNGSNFDIMVAHLIGLDHAGHTHGPTHPELERKLLDVERIVENIIDKMDDETTLLVFGDHGMTQDGSHGGSSEIEMRTVLFSY